MDDFDRVMREMRRRKRALINELGEAALTSVRDGSPITGAPGQPVVSGDLYRSWQLRRSGTTIRIFSALFYAPFIEEGARQRHHRQGLIQFTSNRRALAVGRSGKGGPHSVKLTRVGMQKLADHIVDKLRGVNG